MRVDVLGPLRVKPDGAGVVHLQTKERALLTALALGADHAVPLATLESALWGEDPPLTAERTLQSHVAHLRHDLGEHVIAREPAGYRLALPADAIDATRLEALVAAAQEALTGHEVATAGRWFREAEELWRGEPLTDLADTPDREASVERLRDLWLRAREGRLRADLAQGRHREVLGELQRLVTEDPLREPLWELLILALYRAGNQLGAQQAYGRVRTLLNVELGADPSPQLQRLHGQVLRQDPQLALRPPPPPFVVPEPTSSFVGRAGQAESIAAALSSCRLLTLHGPAGVGKSRLAQETARHVRGWYSDGVWWVDLTACTHSQQVLNQIARTLGVSSSPGRALADSLCDHVRTREILLVLDNCEHVAEPLARHLLTLLQSAPQLHVLATSRVLLHLSGETRWMVRPLAVPDPGCSEEGLLDHDSVALFLERRGGLGDADTPAEAAALCRALDGVPLALELVAVGTQHRTLAEVTGQLVAEVGQASRPVASPAHHSDVMLAIEWGYSQLDPATQQLFDWLAVLPGEFDRSAVESIGSAIPTSDHPLGRRIDQLLDASMIQARPVDGSTRYRLLFVMRGFASAHLDARGERGAASRAFADHYRDVAEDAAIELNGPHAGRWLRRLDTESGNLRAALAWSRDHEAPDRSLPFVPALGRVLWLAPVDLASDADLLRTVVVDAEGAQPDALAWGWQAIVTTTYLSGDLPGALHACECASALFAQVGDLAGQAVVHWHWGATLLLAAGDLPAADRILRRGRTLAREAGVPTAEAWTLAHLVQLGYFTSIPTAETRLFQATAESLADPEDHVIQAHLAMNRAGLEIASGNLEAAADAAQQCREFARVVGVASYEQAGLLLRGLSLLALGREEEAWATGLRAARMALDAGNTIQFGVAVQQLARLTEARDPATAARLWGAATLRSPVIPTFEAIVFPARAARALGDRFDVESEGGCRLSAEAALDLAIG